MSGLGELAMIYSELFKTYKKWNKFMKGV